MARDVVKVRLDLNADDVRWFSETYPSGSLTGIMQLLLSKFREVNDITPAQYAKLAAESIQEERRS